MDRYDLQKLRDLPIEGVAERLGLRVTRHKALCPFHDDHHASLSFSTRRNSFRCFACGAHGNAIDLVMRYLRKDFKEACRWLNQGESCMRSEYSDYSEYSEYSENSKPSFDASRYGRFFEHPWLNDEARRFLFEERRLDARVVAWCRLTSWKDRQGVAWLQTPYYDREGRLTGVQNRNLVRGGWPRFRFPQGAVCGIYNLPILNLLRPGDDLWITEGCSDCWSMLSAGRKAIAIPSATLLSRKDKELLSGLCSNGACEAGEGVSFHMYPDCDEPGERLFLQLQKLLPSLVHHQLPAGCKDFSDYYLTLVGGNAAAGGNALPCGGNALCGAQEAFKVGAGGMRTDS